MVGFLNRCSPLGVTLHTPCYTDLLHWAPWDTNALPAQEAVDKRPPP